MIFCEKCGTKAKVSALFCSSCGAQLQSSEEISDVILSKSRDNSRRKMVLSFGVAGLLACLAYATLQAQNIRSSFDNFLNPVPEKVFIQLAKPATNQGWLQSINLEIQLESNKPNSYQAVLEIKNGGKWESRQIINVLFDHDDMAAKKLNFFAYNLKPGTRELRVKVLRDQGSQELVEISESVKVRILKNLEDMQIADDSNNTIVWRFAKENEEPKYCAKYSKCYFLKIASTKKCQIKATLLLNNKVVSINSARGSSIGSVAAYTPEKSYLIEVPYNSANTGQISARCFALSSGSNQGSTPTPTKKPQKPVENPACSRIAADIEETVYSIWHFDNFTQYDAPDYMYGDLADYRREFDLFQCDVPNSWSYSQYSRLRNW
jgi:hypothetical protein